MYKFSLSWSIKVDGQRDRGALKVAQWPEVKAVLQRLQPHAGSVSVYVVEGPEVGPQKMLLFADNSKYVVVLSELVGDDYRMRSFQDPRASKGEEVNILGQGWNAGQISTDYDDVIEAFRQLITGGSVSRELLG
jgi:hypothetical protein